MRLSFKKALSKKFIQKKLLDSYRESPWGGININENIFFYLKKSQKTGQILIKNFLNLKLKKDD